ncbi:MAG: hydrogenase maturation protease [Cyanobium sp.]
MRARPDLLIGIGNPLRGDDGVGALLVEELAEELGGWSTPAAELKVVHQLTPELACTLAGAERVLFLDACGSARTVQPWLDLLQSEAGADAAAAGLGSHQLEPAVLLALAHALYGWRGEGALLRLPAFAFPHGQALSPSLLEALPEARRLVRLWLQG